MFIILITTLCMAADTLMLTVHRDSGRSILNELRQHGSATDFSKFYKSKKITPKMKPIEYLRSPKQPTLFYHDPTTNKAVVDRDFLSDLTVVSINDLSKQKTLDVGRWVSKREIEPLNLLKQLIEADVLLTYVHLESSMTIEVKEESPNFLAAVKGSHIYYTNDRNEDDFAFQVRIDKTGKITVTSD